MSPAVGKKGMESNGEKPYCIMRSYWETIKTWVQQLESWNLGENCQRERSCATCPMEQMSNWMNRGRTLKMGVDWVVKLHARKSNGSRVRRAHVLLTMDRTHHLAGLSSVRSLNKMFLAFPAPRLWQSQLGMVWPKSSSLYIQPRSQSYQFSLSLVWYMISISL